jgi:ketosteroid isomerase-like protein
MSDIRMVQQLMDRILVQDLDEAVRLLSEDVELTALPSPASSATAEIRQGRAAVRDYFEVLGGIVTFWQVRVCAYADRVLVPGRERYILRCGLESDNEFMLVCQVRKGRIAGIVVIEDVAAMLRGKVLPAMRPTIYRVMPELDDALVSSLSAALEETTTQVRVA